VSDILARANSGDLQFVTHDGFGGFEAALDRDGYAVYRGFTPEVSPDGLWLECRLDGRTVATMAAQPIALAGTLTEHIEGEGLYPSDTDEWEVFGEARPVLDGVTDFAVFTGGYFIATDIRGSDTSRRIMATFPTLTRETARKRWGAEHFFFTTKGDERGRRLAERYSPQVIADGINWYRDGELLEGVTRVVGYMSGTFVSEKASRVVSQSEI
jgi:hypothetical protein